MKEENKWLSFYVLFSWLTNIGHGLIVAILGPTQPYLAVNVESTISSINFVWSGGFVGYVVGSIGTGFAFKKCVIMYFGLNNDSNPIRKLLRFDF